MKLHVIDTELFKLDGGAMFGVVPKVIWNKLNPADEHNLCTWAMRLLLIEDGDRKILIDTGIGDKQSEKFFSYYYLDKTNTLEKSLTAKGFSFADITDVVLTHFHFDHVGGAVKKEGEQLLPAFPNATYWTSRAHLDWALNPNAREKASFLKENIVPLQEAGVFKFVEEGNSPFEHIDFIFVDGHTESQMLPLINTGERRLLYCADLFPSVGHLPLPYVMAYDVRPLETLKEKEEVLGRAIQENWVLFFEHDPKIECCTLEQTDRGIRAKETFALSELF